MDARLNETDKIQKEDKDYMPYVHSRKGPCYCIFRIGRKYKGMSGIKGFQMHMARLKNTLNANPERLNDNIILYGPENIYEDTKQYLKGVIFAKNSTVGRELLLTCSPAFFKGILDKDFEEWKFHNIKWLELNFKDNFRYAVLHMDESTPHIHALVIPKIWNEKKGRYTMQAYQYFNGIEKLRNLQDNYASFIREKFPDLNRGIKGSKAHHISIRQFYNIVNKPLDEQDLNSVLIHAKNEELLRIKIHHLDKTLKSFQNYNRKNEEERQKLYRENKELLNEVEKIQQDKEQYSEAIREISKLYKIDEETFKYALEYVQKKINSNQKKDVSKETSSEKELER